MSLLLFGSTPQYPFPAEEGPLRIEGKTFRTQDGKPWQMRGYSWFLGYLRYCRGEDVTPDLEWLRTNGFNTVRVFGPLPWKETPDYRVENFRYDCLGDFFELLQRYGLRCNWSLGHYEHPDLRAHVQRWYSIARDFDNIMAEGVNEPHVGKEKPDPEEMLDGVVWMYGIPTSYGYYKEALDGEVGLPLVLDHGTLHTPRGDAWPRQARITQEVQHLTGRPWVDDEPAKITEPGFNYPGGKNDPKRTPLEASWHFGVLALWTAIGTYHSEEGKWGRVPTPGMLQHMVMEAVRDNVFKRMGPDIQLGEYNRGGNSDSPVNNVYTEDNQIWTYTSLHAHDAWSVRCGNVPLVARNGWTIVDSWANGTMAHLQR